MYRFRLRPQREVPTWEIFSPAYLPVPTRGLSPALMVVPSLLVPSSHEQPGSVQPCALLHLPSCPEQADSRLARFAVRQGFCGCGHFSPIQPCARQDAPFPSEHCLTNVPAKCRWFSLLKAVDGRLMRLARGAWPVAAVASWRWRDALFEGPF